jgi:hypothetical protein
MVMVINCAKSTENSFFKIALMGYMGNLPHFWNEKNLET